MEQHPTDQRRSVRDRQMYPSMGKLSWALTVSEQRNEHGYNGHLGEQTVDRSVRFRRAGSLET